jgi:hypothetical protein
MKWWRPLNGSAAATIGLSMAACGVAGPVGVADRAAERRDHHDLRGHCVRRAGGGHSRDDDPGQSGHAEPEGGPVLPLPFAAVYVMHRFLLSLCVMVTYFSYRYA